MEHLAVAVVNAFGVAAFFGGIAVCVWLDQRGKTRRREFEHAERMLAFELGRPLDDAPVARYRAIGAAAVAIPIAGLSAATVGSCFSLLFREPEWRFLTLTVVWLVCGAVCLLTLPGLLAELRKAPARQSAGEGAGLADRYENDLKA